MPPQKNAGNRGAKRETGASIKNRKFVHNFIDDLRSEGAVDHVHIGRVIRRLGDGRMEVFYVEKVKGEQRGKAAQAKIPGKFSGRGKHSVWIDVGSFVAISDTGVNGSAAFEISAVFTPEQMRDIAKEFELDPRLLMVDNTDSSQLVNNKTTKHDAAGYEFDTVEEQEEDFDIEDI